MRTRITKKVSWLTVAALVAGAVVATVPAVTASAVDIVNSTISGNVKGAGTPNNVNLGDVTVELYNSIGDHLPVAQQYTDGSGNFTFTDVVQGWYTVKYKPSDGVYAPAFFGGASSLAAATYFSVGVGATVTGKSIVLAVGATISGNIKGTPSTNLEYAFAELYTAGGEYVTSSMTDETGNYTIAGVAPGAYTLQFTGDGFTLNYVSQWLGGATTQAAATTFTVTGTTPVTGKNAVLAVGAQISGTVSSSTTPNGGQVDLYDTSGNYVSGASIETGHYSFIGVPAGTYTLAFSFYGGQNFVSEYWENAATLETATYFSVAANAAVTKNAVVAAGATVSGTVTGTGGAGVQSGVTLYTADGSYATGAYSDPSGNYSLSGIGAGTYYVVANPSNGSTSYFAGQTSNFAVGASATVTGKNVVLAPAAAISGQLLTEDNEAINGGVALYSTSGSTDDWDTFLNSVTLEADGSYFFGGLEPGTYKVGFTSTNQSFDYETGSLAPSQGGFVSSWYGPAFSYSAASTVTISSATQVVSGIDGTVVYPTFSDVAAPSSAFYPYIEWMSAQNISTGTAQVGAKPVYLPANAVSRQAMASFLYKLSGDTFLAPTTPSFADVSLASPFYTAIEWMKAEGISTGTPQPSGLPLFKPADPVSRSAMASFLSRYDGVTLTTPTTQVFADVPLSASTAAAIGWMYDTGISTGTPQSSGLPLYNPSAAVSRQAMAAFLYRLAHLT